MPEVFVGIGEQYPFYFIEPTLPGRIVRLTDEEHRMVIDAMAAFDKAQNVLERAYKAGRDG